MKTAMQRIIFPLSHQTQGLYLHADCPLAFTRRGLRLGPGQSAALSGWFNVLDETFYATYTTARAFTLNLTVADAPVRLRLVRTTLDEVSTTLQERELAPGRHEFAHAIAPGQTGLVHLEIEALGAGAQVRDMSWDCEVGEKKTLDIVICTYKREEYVRRTLESLRADEGLHPFLERVIVVDNASELPQDVAQWDKVALIAQGNLGGAGGFSRGMYESMQDGSSHVLVMDDDIVMETESVYRAILLQHVLKDKTALAGSMLELERPGMLFERGALLWHDEFGTPLPWRIMSVFNGLEVEHGAIGIHTCPMEFDYGAFWFFCFPKELLHKVGLCAPFFVLVDDIDFSVRLRKEGCRIVSPMGMSVWHMEFARKGGVSKFSLWVRNHLIAYIAHENPGRLFLIRHLMQAVCLELVKSRYNTALCVLSAYDYVLDKRGDETLDYFGYLKSVEAQFVPDNQARVKTPPQLTRELFIRVRPGMLRWAMVVLSLCGALWPGFLLRKTPAILRTKPDNWLKALDAREILVCDNHTGRVTHCRLERGRTLGLLGRTLRTGLRMLFGGIGADYWRAWHRRETSVEAWLKRFKIGEEPR